jgi:hypothetical protein
MTITGAALLAATLAPGGHARAAAAGTTACAGSQTVTYSPGVTDQARQVTLHGTTTLGRCVSTADPSITSGTSTFTATGRLSCTSGTYSGTRKIRWNNGRTSTLSFNSVVSVNGGESVVAIRGTVTGGEFSGQKWSGAFTMFTAKPAACDTSQGIPTATGAVLLTIGSPAKASAPGRTLPIDR